MVLLRRGYRACGRCREIKPTQRFYKRKTAHGPKPDSWCKDCRRDYARKMRAQTLADPVRAARWRKRVRDYQRECAKDPAWRARHQAYHRAWLARMTAAERVAYLQDQRMSATIRRRDAGQRAITRPANVPGAYVEPLTSSGEPLDAAPLLAALGDEFTLPDAHPMSRRLRALRAGAPRVSDHVADHLLVIAGHDQLPDVYPELYA